MTHKKALLIGWLGTALGLPAGLAVIAKFDDRLDFGPLLERTVLNFNLVSRNCWSLAGSFLGRDLSAIHGTLTFYAMAAGVIITSYFSTGKDGPAAEMPWLKAFEFLAQGGLLAIFLLDFPPIFSWGFILMWAIFSAFLYGSHRLHPSKLNKSVALPSLAFSLTALVLAVSLLSDTKEAGVIVAALLGSLMILVNDHVGPGRLAFLRIAIFALGIFAISFLADTVRPAIEAYFDRIGA